MKIHTKAVHAGDRKKAASHVPVTTPIHTATSYFYDSMAQLDRIFGQEEEGYCYARYDNPSAAALEELMCALEGGHGALACASGMAALQMAVTAALVDRPRSIVAANALYGATVGLLMNVLEPAGVAIRFADPTDTSALAAAIDEARPGCVLIETISNPLLRVGEVDRIAAIAHAVNAALVVDNTFATPLVARPLEWGADFTVHSLTKYLAGHGDVLGGVVVTSQEHTANLRRLSRTLGPVLGPFECYLTMRGIKTFPLRMERQCANACRVASWLSAHPKVERLYFTGRPGASRRRHHPPPVPAEPLRRHGELRAARRGPRGGVPIHGRAEPGGTGHVAGRCAQHDALPGDEFAPRDFSETPLAHGHPRQPGAALGGNRSAGGYRGGPGAGTGEGVSTSTARGTLLSRPKYHSLASLVLLVPRRVREIICESRFGGVPGPDLLDGCGRQQHLE